MSKNCIGENLDCFLMKNFGNKSFHDSKIINLSLRFELFCCARLCKVRIFRCNALHLSRERDDCNLDATMKKVNAHGVIVTSGGGAS